MQPLWPTHTSPTWIFIDWKNAALQTERVRSVALRWHAGGSKLRLGLQVGL
jgi:hypothetical protein